MFTTDEEFVACFVLVVFSVKNVQQATVHSTHTITETHTHTHTQGCCEASYASLSKRCNCFCKRRSSFFQYIHIYRYIGTLRYILYIYIGSRLPSIKRPSQFQPSGSSTVYTLPCARTSSTWNSSLDVPT